MTGDYRHPIGFIALWDSKRSEYHADQAEEITTSRNIQRAFNLARENGVKIFGHYYCRWTTDQKTFTFWHCPSIETLDAAMDWLEKAGDFKFALSEHRLGAMLSTTAQTDPDFFALENGCSDLPYAFIAFWKWKDSYYRASPAELQAYEEAVNLAFAKAEKKGIRMLGKYDCSFDSPWHYFTFWLSPSFEAIEESMDLLEAAGDFKFAESRHMIGVLEKGNRFGRKLQEMGN